MLNGLRQVLLAALCTVLLCISAVSAASAQTSLKGVALIIGQSKYQHLPPLTNPANDAQAIGRIFTDLGFSVTVTTDRDAARLSRDLSNFASDAEGADAAVVYYSGHGIEAGGENWLVPVDADLSALDNAATALVPLSSLMDELSAAVPLTLLFLDACRTNPFPPGAVLRDSDGHAAPIGASGLAATKGVTAIEADPQSESLGALIGFAAEPGRPALDGPPDGNSPYAAALVRHLAAASGAEFGLVMRMVTEEVYLKTDGRQRPWVNETLMKALYFGGRPEDPASDAGRLNQGRRALLLTIGSLPQQVRRNVEDLAKASGLPLDPLYGMLRELEVDTSRGPEALDQQLRAGAEALKKLRQRNDTITGTDPDILRFTELADQAEREGAIPLAADYRASASARAAEVSAALTQTGSQLKERHLEVAATFAREGQTAILSFDHRKAAERFALAFAEARDWDARIARDYKWSEADALIDLGEFKGDNAAIERSLDSYKLALDLSQRLDDQDGWAELQNNLGTALASLGKRHADITLLQQAVAAFRAAEPFMPRDRMALEWAGLQNNLGAALQIIGESGHAPGALREAIAAYRSALEVYSPEQNPSEWAGIQSNLGNALSAIGAQSADGESLQQAVDAYHAALTRWTRDRAPLNWALAQNNLGITLRIIGEREAGTARLAEAVEAFDRALEEWTRERVPLQWAAAQMGRGNALLSLGQREQSIGLLREATQAFRAALEEQTRERAPVEWAATQSNLGSALLALGEQSQGTAELEQAITAFRNAAEEAPRGRMPFRWAMIQNNLGQALSTLGERKRNVKLVRAGRDAVNSAWGTARDLGYTQYDAYFADRLAGIDAVIARLTK